MAWAIETGTDLGTLSPTTSSATYNWTNLSGSGVYQIAFTLSANSSLEIVCSPEQDQKNTAVYYATSSTNSFTLNTSTGAGSTASAAQGSPSTWYKSIFINNTSTTNVLYGRIWIHAATEGTTLGTVNVYYACHTYNQCYVLNTETISVTKTQPGQSIMIDQTPQSICFKREVRKIAATIPAYCKATFYTADINIIYASSTYVDNYGYLSTSDVGISTGGVPTNYQVYNDQGGGNSQWKITYTNITSSPVVVYLYSRCYSVSGNVNRGSALFYYGEDASAILASGWSYWNGGSTYYPTWMSGKGSVKNTTVDPATITNIVFQTAAYTGAYSASWDASELANGSVTAYVNGTQVIVSANGADKIIGGNYLNICNNMAACTTVTGCANIDTSAVMGFHDTFTGSGITSIPSGVTSWQTSQATDFQGAFWNCRSLTTINLSWNTRNGTNFQGVFGYCVNLTTLYISNFNTTKATNLSYFLSNCLLLHTITVGANFKQGGASGSVTGAEFPDHTGSTYLPMFTDAIVDGRWRNKSTAVIYANNAIPQASASYSCYLPDGRTTFMTHNEASTSWGYNYNINGVTHYASSWIYALYQRGTVSNTTLMNTVKESITTIETRDSYTPDGTQTYSWDVSQYQDGKVIAYYWSNTGAVIIAGNGAGYIDLGSYAGRIFSYLPALTALIIPHMTTYTGKTAHMQFWVASTPNIERMDISGLDFANFTQNVYEFTYVVARSVSNNVQTNIQLLDKLSYLKVGSGYYRVHAGPLPVPSQANTVVPTGYLYDGSWHDETGTSYTPGSYNSDTTITAPSIPNLTAHTYTAYYEPAVTPPTPSVHSAWKYYDGSSWVQVYPKYFNGTEWILLTPTVYDGTEWK